MLVFPITCMPLTKGVLQMSADDFKVGLPDAEQEAIDEAVDAVTTGYEYDGVIPTDQALATLLNQAKIDRSCHTVIHPRDGKPMKGTPVSDCIIQCILSYLRVIAPEETTLD